MANTFFYGVGGVVSADIAVPEHARELRFYSQVLTTGSTPLWKDDLSNNRGTPIIGLGERVPAYEALPLQWMPHIQVADIAASAARAIELGGQEVMHGKDDDGNSQWAVLVDPEGAAFGLIAVVDGSDTTLQHEGSGRICGLSLAAADAPALRAFYEQVIGWSGAEIHENAGGLPSVWILHLPVGDLDASLGLVREGGGEVVMQSDGYAVIRDPVGVHIGLQADG